MMALGRVSKELALVHKQHFRVTDTVWRYLGVFGGARPKLGQVINVHTVLR